MQVRHDQNQVGSFAGLVIVVVVVAFQGKACQASFAGRTGADRTMRVKLFVVMLVNDDGSRPERSQDQDGKQARGGE